GEIAGKEKTHARRRPWVLVEIALGATSHGGIVNNDHQDRNLQRSQNHQWQTNRARPGRSSLESGALPHPLCRKSALIGVVRETDRRQRCVTRALWRKLAVHQFNLANRPAAEFGDVCALNDFACSARGYSDGLDAANGQVRLEKSFFFVVAKISCFPFDSLLKFSQRFQLAADAGPEHARL